MASIKFSIGSNLLIFLVLFSLFVLHQCDENTQVKADAAPDQCIPIHEQSNLVPIWCCPANIECYDTNQTCHNNCH
ncbi:hypothetical protein RDI58_023438 [Solanum bulbocastanum]|uniref:Uncharacterized protein n=1 Tax=Solanum bulbocastanum TaxID=147425 RepID=A0AAN8Y6M0_SOLBU